MFKKDDYIEGIETVGIFEPRQRLVKGWVDQYYNSDPEMIAIQADDEFDGHRGTAVRADSAILLPKKDRPRWFR